MIYLAHNLCTWSNWDSQLKVIRRYLEIKQIGKIIRYVLSNSELSNKQEKKTKKFNEAVKSYVTN